MVGTESFFGLDPPNRRVPPVSTCTGRRRPEGPDPSLPEAATKVLAVARGPAAAWVLVLKYAHVRETSPVLETKSG